MTTTNQARPGDLTTIACSSSKIRELRNAALNIMERIKETNELYATLMVSLKDNGLGTDRMVQESQLNHLDRTVLNLANTEADVSKAELLSNTRADLASMTKPHAPVNEHMLPTSRHSNKVARFLGKLADKIG